MTPSATLPRVLIADDQQEVLQALRILLKGEGFAPHLVSSPAALLEALRSSTFDMVLMDLNYAQDTTSGQEGLNLLSEIREFDSTLPIIVMTGWGSVELAVEAMRRGVQDFIQKPWDNEHLIQLLHKHVQEGQVLRKEKRLEAEKQTLTRAIGTSLDLHMLAERVAEQIRRTLKNRSVIFFTRAPADRAFWEAARAGNRSSGTAKIKFEADAAFLRYMPEIFDPREKEMPEAERSRLQKSDCDLIVPVSRKSELMGFIGLGGKLSGKAFDAEDLQFLRTVVEQVGVGIENLRLRGRQREYEEAREIQQGLLPKQIPQISHHEIFGSWLPATAVGGDYYDALRFSDSKVALCIADVVGKGLPAALLMCNLQAAVRAFALESMNPRDLCAKVNRVICSNIAANKFITFFYCLYDAVRRRMLFANAGHNAPILLKKDGSHRRLETGGAVLGVFPDWSYDQEEVEFCAGDRVVLFTDGVTEARDSKGEEFGEGRLLSLLQERRRLGARELQKGVMETLADYCGGEFQDDATLILMSADTLA